MNYYSSLKVIKVYIRGLTEERLIGDHLNGRGLRFFTTLRGVYNFVGPLHPTPASDPESLSI